MLKYGLIHVKEIETSEYGNFLKRIYPEIYSLYNDRALAIWSNYPKQYDVTKVTVIENEIKNRLYQLKIPKFLLVSYTEHKNDSIMVTEVITNCSFLVGSYKIINIDELAKEEYLKSLSEDQIGVIKCTLNNYVNKTDDKFISEKRDKIIYLDKYRKLH